MPSRMVSMPFSSAASEKDDAAKLKQTYIRLYTEAKMENNLRMIHFYGAILETFEKQGKAREVKWSR